MSDLYVGKVVGERGKAYKVEAPMERRDNGNRRNFDFYMAKSKTVVKDGHAYIASSDRWMIDNNYTELEKRLDQYRRPFCWVKDEGTPPTGPGEEPVMPQGEVEAGDHPENEDVPF